MTRLWMIWANVRRRDYSIVTKTVKVWAPNRNAAFKKGNKKMNVPRKNRSVLRIYEMEKP
jgi:hypothetical protein